MRYFLFFFLIFLIPAGSEAVVVLKSKGKRILIGLEGLKTKKGAYFSAFDLYGKEKGLVRIKKAARTKAIGVVKYGSAAKHWSLEPTSGKRAEAIQIKAKRKARRIALIKKAKKARKLAQKNRMDRKSRAAKRKLAQKRKLKRRKLARKKAIMRKLAAYEGADSYEMDHFQDNPDSQSDEVLSYNSDWSANMDFSGAESSESLNGQGASGSDPHIMDNISQPSAGEKPGRLIFGFAPRGEYSFMKLSPRRQPTYLMAGPGYGGLFFADFSLNDFLRAEGNIGAKFFSVSAEEEKCGQDGGCALDIYYLSAGLALKVNLLDFGGHKLWLGAEGVLLQPLAYSNDILTRDSFAPLHGTVGGGLGADFSFGNFILPVSVRGGLYMPATKTVTTGTLGLSLGLAYKF